MLLKPSTRALLEEITCRFCAMLLDKVARGLSRLHKFMENHIPNRLIRTRQFVRKEAATFYQDATNWWIQPPNLFSWSRVAQDDGEYTIAVFKILDLTIATFAQNRMGDNYVQKSVCFLGTTLYARLTTPLQKRIELMGKSFTRYATATASIFALLIVSLPSVSFTPAEVKPEARFMDIGTVRIPTYITDNLRRTAPMTYSDVAKDIDQTIGYFEGEEHPAADVDGMVWGKIEKVIDRDSDDKAPAYSVRFNHEPHTIRTIDADDVLICVISGKWNTPRRALTYSSTGTVQSAGIATAK